MDYGRHSPSAATTAEGGHTRGANSQCALRLRRAVRFRRAVLTVGVIVLSGALLGVLASIRQGSTTTQHGPGVAATQRSASPHSASEAKYGGLPSWLPRTKARPNRIVSANASHAALAIQGNTVSVSLPRGRVLATAVGPEVPEEGHFPVPATSPCTFVVTLAAATGVIPIDPRAFVLIDDLGHLRHPHVSAMDGGPPPSQVDPGKTVSLKLHDVLPTGDGGLAWRPSGTKPIVIWDFVVEID